MAAGAPDDVDTYRRHAGELIRYATALVGPDDAPDVVTEGVLAAFATPGWSNVVNRRAYLYRAVFTRSLSHRRSVSRRQRETIVDGPIADQPSAPDDDPRRRPVGGPHGADGHRRHRGPGGGRLTHQASPQTR